MPLQTRPILPRPNPHQKIQCLIQKKEQTWFLACAEPARAVHPRLDNAVVDAAVFEAGEAGFDFGFEVVERVGGAGAAGAHAGAEGLREVGEVGGGSPGGWRVGGVGGMGEEVRGGADGEVQVAGVDCGEGGVAPD